jgi:glycosyltransferase involved in cell wall biosynthesis
MSAGAAPTVSVVVPSLNSGRFIGAALDSALAQEGATLEVLIQDGGSTDGTLAAVRARAGDPRLRLASEPDLGQADALNRAIAAARGQWVMWLNADDLLAPGALAALAPALAGPHEVVFGDFHLVDERGAVVKRYTSAPALDRRRLLTHGCYVFSGSLAVRRRLYERLGAYDASLSFCMDYEFLLRVAPHVSARHCGRELSLFRHQPDSKTSREALGFFLESAAVRRRYGGFSGRLLLPTARRQAGEDVYLLTRRLWQSRAWRRVEPRRGL